MNLIIQIFCYFNRIAYAAKSAYNDLGNCRDYKLMLFEVIIMFLFIQNPTSNYVFQLKIKFKKCVSVEW